MTRVFGNDDENDYHRQAEAYRRSLGLGNLFEEFYDLVNDPPLHNVGMQIGARVRKQISGLVHNRIVFRVPTASKLNWKEAEVTCVHIALMSGTLEEIPDDNTDGGVMDFQEMAQSTEGKPITLPAEEHFVALKSYVAGIAEMGISNLLVASYWGEEVNPESLPFGFNSAMHKQVARCLAAVAPRAAYNVLTNLWEELQDKVSPEWLKPRLSMLKKMYGIEELERTASKEERTDRVKAAKEGYGEDWEIAYNIWSVETYSQYDVEKGQFVAKNLVTGLEPGMAGYPVSPEGWVVRKEGWEIYQSAPKPGDTFYWWREMPEPWKTKCEGFFLEAETDLLRAIQKAVVSSWGANSFMRSIKSQVTKWMSEVTPKFPTPLSRKQVEAVIRMV